MHALLLSFCRYFAKIADARGAMSLSLVKCQVKKFLSAACRQGACAEAPFCVTMTVAIEFHSRALIRAHVRSRRHFAKLPLQNSRDGSAVNLQKNFSSNWKAFSSSTSLARFTTDVVGGSQESLRSKAS